MKKILIEVSVGELLDKISILDIKLVKITDKNSLVFIKKEYESLNSVKKQILDTNIDATKQSLILDYYNQLKSINEKLWYIEDEKRLCEKNSDFGEKFIKLSRDVHFLNDKRAEIKLNCNQVTDFDFREIKQYTKY